MSGKNIFKLTGCIVLTTVVGGVSGFIIKDDIRGWYATLAKPVFNPPNYLFGPVWTALYILMGISFYIILNTIDSRAKKVAITAFALQLFLNFWWSIIFFSFHQIAFAFGEIVLLWLCIGWMIFAFYKQKPVAGYLQIPYLLWVTFASVLNLSVLLLN